MLLSAMSETFFSAVVSGGGECPFVVATLLKSVV
jgi:hypothetical protein